MLVIHYYTVTLKQVDNSQPIFASIRNVSTVTLLWTTDDIPRDNNMMIFTQIVVIIASLYLDNHHTANLRSQAGIILIVALDDSHRDWKLHSTT